MNKLNFTIPLSPLFQVNWQAAAWVTNIQTLPLNSTNVTYYTWLYEGLYIEKHKGTACLDFIIALQ